MTSLSSGSRDGVEFRSREVLVLLQTIEATLKWPTAVQWGRSITVALGWPTEPFQLKSSHRPTSCKRHMAVEDEVPFILFQYSFINYQREFLAAAIALEHWFAKFLRNLRRGCTEVNL